MKHEDEGGLGPSFHEWEREVPGEVTRDSLWLVEAYRLALYLGDMAWRDAMVAAKDRRAVYIADQLQRAAHKISASIAEGYSRDSGKARSTYYEYALGSARESRDWYYKLRYVLAPPLVQHRISLCTQIVRLTLTMIASERRRKGRVSDSQ